MRTLPCPRQSDPSGPDRPHGASGLVVLQKRSDFLRAAKGRKAAARGLVLQFVPGEADHTDIRVGFTASRKVGSAVKRNRAKRRLREAARAVLCRTAQPGGTYVIIARESTLERPLTALMGDLRWSVARVHGEPPRDGGTGKRRRGKPS